MFLDELIVLQCRSDQTELKLQLREALGAVGYCLDTCLRTVWVTDDSVIAAELFCRFESADLKIFQGEQAYELLLRIACGLESVVKGETEVFAQIKSSWQSFSDEGRPFARKMRPWMQKLFADTKDIRKSFLQGIGGSSYGSLARKICGPESNDKVLILGMGQLGEAVAPLFNRYKLLVWNRDKTKLQKNLDKLAGKRSAHVEAVSDEELHAAIRDVEHIIVCTPAGISNEQAWIAARKDGDQRGKIVHLGGKAYLTTAWQSLKNFHSLSDIFDLQSDQNHLKSERIKRAGIVCREKAKQRYMMDALAMNHGWEDLPAF